MKGALVVKGGALFPDQAKGKRLGVTEFCMEAVDPNLTVKWFLDMRAAGWKLRLMRDPVWDHYDRTPELWAKQFSDDIARFQIASGEQCALMADIEVHDEAYVYAALKELRRLRPGRGVVWAPESFQGGWFSPRLVDLLNSDPMLTVAPQSYRGDMTPRAMDEAFRDVLVRGVAQEKILGFYPCTTVGPDKDSAGQLARRYTNPPDDWNGWLYDFGNVKG